jgi:hypothetical protein
VGASYTFTVKQFKDHVGLKNAKLAVSQHFLRPRFWLPDKKNDAVPVLAAPALAPTLPYSNQTCLKQKKK